MTAEASAWRRWLPTPALRASALLHTAALPALAARPSAWPWVAGALLADHVVLTGAGLLPRSRLLGPNLRRLPPRPDAPRVALTFDDGPDPEVTPRVLDLLAARGARASFFCVGRRARRHPAVVARIVAEGHGVENHSDRHSNAFWFYPPGRLGRELEAAQRALREAGGGPAPTWFRAPAGIRSPWLQGALAGSALRLASWTRRGFDTVARDPARVLERLTDGLADGDVLLLHDGSAARTAAGVPVVLEALPGLLDALERAGLAAEPLP